MAKMKGMLPDDALDNVAGGMREDAYSSWIREHEDLCGRTTEYTEEDRRRDEGKDRGPYSGDVYSSGSYTTVERDDDPPVLTYTK